MIQRDICVPIFFRAVQVIVGTRDEFVQWFMDCTRHECDVGDDADGHCCWVKSGKSSGSIIVWVSDGLSAIQQLAILAHELSHAVTFIMQFLGFDKTRDEHDELRSYLLAHLTERVICEVWGGVVLGTEKRDEGDEGDGDV